MIRFGTCIDTIKLFDERRKAFYSVGLGNNWSSVSSKLNIGGALIHEFLIRSNSYYEMKCSSSTLMGENHYSFYVVCCNACFKYT